MDQLPIMGRANCNFLAFGVEAGTQKILDRLDKRQTLEQIEKAVSEAKRCGIERAHGFFLVGSPGETEEDILESFRFCARSKLDTFGFNRLCVYRGTPLWHEYLERGILDDERDWDKWFKCSDIDPTVSAQRSRKPRAAKRLRAPFARRIFFRPIQTFKLIRTLGRHMKYTDIFRLLSSPFRRRKLNRKPELPIANDRTGFDRARPDRRGVGCPGSSRVTRRAAFISIGGVLISSGGCVAAARTTARRHRRH